MFAGGLWAQDEALFARALQRHGLHEYARGVAESALLNPRLVAAERVGAADALVAQAAWEFQRGDEDAWGRLLALLERVSPAVYAQDPVEWLWMLEVQASAFRAAAAAQLVAAEDPRLSPSQSALAMERALSLRSDANALASQITRVPKALDALRASRQLLGAAELRLSLLSMGVEDREGGRGQPLAELVAQAEELLLDIPESVPAFRRIYLDGLLLLARLDLLAGRVEAAWSAAREVLQLVHVHENSNRVSVGVAERAALVLCAAAMRDKSLLTEARQRVAGVLATPAGEARGALLLASADAALVSQDEAQADACLSEALRIPSARALALRRLLQRPLNVVPDLGLLRTVAAEAMHVAAIRESALELLNRVRVQTVRAQDQAQLERWLAELSLAASDADAAVLHALLAARHVVGTDRTEAQRLMAFASSLPCVASPRVRVLREELANQLGLGSAQPTQSASETTELRVSAARCDQALAAKDLGAAQSALLDLLRLGASQELVAAARTRLATLALELHQRPPASEGCLELPELTQLMDAALATGGAESLRTAFIRHLVDLGEVALAQQRLPQDVAAASAELAGLAWLACVECAETQKDAHAAGVLLTEAERWRARSQETRADSSPRRQRAEALLLGGLRLKNVDGLELTKPRGEASAAARIWAEVLRAADPDSPAAWEARWHQLHLMWIAAQGQQNAVHALRRELARLHVLTSGRFDDGVWASAFVWLQGQLP
jgi:hypothetical protein